MVLFFFCLKYTISVLSALLLRIIGRIHSELGLTSEHCCNIVRNTLVLNMTKPRKRVFHLSDFQTAVQLKLISTIWSLFIETYTTLLRRSLPNFAEISCNIIKFEIFFTLLTSEFLQNFSESSL